jgi:hypothetical protein
MRQNLRDCESMVLREPALAVVSLGEDTKVPLSPPIEEWGDIPGCSLLFSSCGVALY